MQVLRSLWLTSLVATLTWVTLSPAATSAQDYRVPPPPPPPPPPAWERLDGPATRAPEAPLRRPATERPVAPSQASAPPAAPGRRAPGVPPTSIAMPVGPAGSAPRPLYRRAPVPPYNIRSWNSPWVVSARISAWAPKPSGTFTDAADSISPGGSDDPLKLDYRGIQGQLELSRGAWTLRGEKTYASVSGTLFRINDMDAVRAGAELDMDQTMLGYRLRPIELGFKVRNRPVFLSTELNAGLRFYNIDLWGEAGGLRVEIGTSEIDPVVGVRLDLPLSAKLKLTVSADVGGFGVGTDISSMILGEIDYRFSRHWSMQLGWRHLYMEKEYGIDDFALRWHATLSGPSLALKYTF